MRLEPCVVCGCSFAWVALPLLLAPALKESPRWPKRRRAWMPCPECDHPKTAQFINRDILEVM